MDRKDWWYLLRKQPQLVRYLTKLDADAEALKEDECLREMWEEEMGKLKGQKFGENGK